MGEAGDGAKDCKRAVKGSRLSRSVPRPFHQTEDSHPRSPHLDGSARAGSIFSCSAIGNLFESRISPFMDSFGVRPARARNAVVHCLVTSIILSSAFLSMSLL